MKSILYGLSLLSVLLISCADEKAITVDRFRDFPEEIDGCACYFSANKEDFIEGNYIYADTYHENAYISINGKMIQFTLKSYTDIEENYWVKRYTNEKYEVTLESKEIWRVDETWQQKGTMTIKSKNGKTIKETIYGECGC